MSRKRRHGQDGGLSSHHLVDQHQPKRAKTYTAQDSQLADIFDRLSHEVEQDRFDAIRGLTDVVTSKLSADATSVERIVVRLIRGLCSGRKAARLGFVIALSEVLRQIFKDDVKPVATHELTPKRIVELIIDRTKPEGDVAGQEKRDHLYGRLFGFKAAIESRILFRPDVDMEPWDILLQEVYTLARDTPWIRKECGSMLCDSVTALDGESSSKTKLQKMVQGLVENGLVKTPEGVALWLAIRNHHPSFDFPRGHWHKHDPLCTKERQNLANAMKGGSHNTQQSKEGSKPDIKGGSAQAMVSPAWDVVLATVFENSGSDRRAKKKFSTFWVDVVDNSLFSSSASLEKKSWGLQLLSKVVKSGPDWTLSALISPNLSRCLINQLAEKDRYLHHAARTCLRDMKLRAEKEPQTAASFVCQLLSASIPFDQITRTKTLQELVSIADSTTLQEIATFCRPLMLKPGTEDQQTAENDRRILADLMLAGMRSRSPHNTDPSDFVITSPPAAYPDLNEIEDQSWITKLFLTLTELAFFNPKPGASPQCLRNPRLSENTQKMFQSRLTSCLTHLITTKLDDEAVYPFLVANTIHQWSNSWKVMEIVFEADQDIVEAVNDAQKRLLQINEKHTKETKSASHRAFKLLYSLTLLQVYQGDADAVAILGELATCCDSLMSRSSRTSDSLDVLFELILSFISRSSMLSRRLGEQIFMVFASDITESSLESMLDVLAKKESLAGQQDLFDEAGSEDSDSGSDNEDEVGSDVEIVDGSTGSEDEDDEHTSSSADEDDDEELEKFDALLAETLKTSRAKDEGQEDETSSDEDMDDDQMMELEPHLTNIFQERKKSSNKKKEQKDARENIINFKNRVLDLLLILVRQQPDKAICVNIIVPMLELVRTTSSKQVAEKASTVLKQYFEKSKNKGLPVQAASKVLSEQLSKVHSEVVKGGSKLFTSTCSRASIFLAKVMVAVDSANFQIAVHEYSNTQERWLLANATGLSQSFFLEWFEWCKTMKAKA